MTMRLPSWVGLAILLAVAPAEAQSVSTVLPVRVRLLAASGEGTRQLTGRLEAITPESLYVRADDRSGAVHRVARSDVRRLERSRPVSVIKAAGVGCLLLGGAFGLLSLGTVNDPNTFPAGGLGVAVSVVAGCGLGALAGALVGAGQGAWEPFDLPMPEPASRPPPDQPL